MKRRIQIAGAWCVVGLMLTAASFAGLQNLPEGEGKKVIEGQCASCHSLETAVRGNRDREKWRETVLRMVQLGAPIKENDVTVAVDYLAKNFGPGGAAIGLTAEEERTAKKHIDGICSTCHEATLIRDTKATKEEWLVIVRTMNSKGAGLSDVDVELLAEYLARNFGPR